MSIFDRLFKTKGTSANTQSTADDHMRADNLTFLQAMEAIAKQDSPETRRGLYEAMLKAWFLVPTSNSSVPAAPGKYVSDGRTPVSIPIICDAHGKRIVPTFTDEEALAHWAGPSRWFALQGISFFQGVVKTDADQIAVNPFPPGRAVIRPTGRITRSEFQALSEGMIPQADLVGKALQVEVRRQQRVMLGMPAKMPQLEFFEALTAAAKGNSNILALYFCQIVFEGSTPHGAIAIDVPAGISKSQTEQIIGALGSAIQPLLSKNQFIDFFPSTAGGLADSIKREGKAIYVAAAQ